MHHPRKGIGFQEGEVVRTASVCECVWSMLTSHPPQYKLEKKCETCIAQERIKPEDRFSDDSIMVKIFQKLFPKLQSESQL